MKKAKLLAGAAVLSVALLGTGYAYWTDALQIESTVKTGNLEVEFTEAVPVGTNNTFADKYIAPDKQLATIDETKNKVNLTLDNLYPGAKQQYKLTIANSGSIGVKLEDVNITPPTLPELIENDGPELIYFAINQTGDPVQYRPGDYLSNTDALKAAIKEAITGEELPSGESRTIYMTFHGNMACITPKYEKGTFELGIETSWTQYNGESADEKADRE